MCTPVVTDNQRVEIIKSLLRRRIGNGPWEHRVISRSADGQFVTEFLSRQSAAIAKTTIDGSAEHSFRSLQALADQPFEFLSVPQVIAYDRQTKTLITTRVGGNRCELMKPAESRAQLNRVGRALKELHSCNASLGKNKFLKDHLQELVRPSPMVLAIEFPRFAEIIEKTMNSLQSSEDSWGMIGTVPLHRDFHLRQLFDDDDCVAVVDWDYSAHGDPAFDVAYFITYLKNHFSAAEAAFGIEAFLSGYQIDADTRSRLETYELFNYLRRACRRFRLQDSGWQASMEQMMMQLKSRV